MTVGIVTAFLGNLKAGTWTYAMNLLAHLAPHGVVAIERHERELELPAGTRKVVVAGGAAIPKIVWPNVTLPRAAADHNLRLVHAPNPFATAVPSRYRNVVTIHDLTPLLLPATHGRGNVWFHRLVLPEVVRRADAVITVSAHSKLDLVTLLGVDPEKIAVIHNGVSTGFTPHGSRADFGSPYFLYVGTLEPRKNLRRLLSSFVRARQAGMEHRLVVVGVRGWGDVESLGIDLPPVLREDVVFSGFVTEENLPALYRGATALVYPSLYEGFGLPVAEAMAAGCPVLTSAVSSLPEVAGDAALLVDPLSETEITAALLKLAEDTELRDLLRERGFERARNYTWERAAAETLGIYRQLLGEELQHKVLQ